MLNIERQYPEVEEYLDDTDEYENIGTEFKQGSDRYLIVTQRGIDGQQLLFKWNGSHFEYWDNETIIDNRLSLPGWSFPADAKLDATVAICGPSSGADHDKVYRYALTQVDVFDFSSGPDGGNLARPLSGEKADTECHDQNVRFNYLGKVQHNRTYVTRAA